MADKRVGGGDGVRGDCVYFGSISFAQNVLAQSILDPNPFCPSSDTSYATFLYNSISQPSSGFHRGCTFY